MVKLQDVEMKDVSMPPSEGGEKKEEEVKKDPDLLTLEGKNHPFRTPSVPLHCIDIWIHTRTLSTIPTQTLSLALTLTVNLTSNLNLKL